MFLSICHKEDYSTCGIDKKMSILGIDNVSCPCYIWTIFLYIIWTYFLSKLCIEKISTCNIYKDTFVHT